MKKTLTEYEFIQEVEQWEDRKEHFTLDGWRAIYRYIDDIDGETGQDTELDIVALCCEFSEYSSALAAAEECNGAVEENKDFDDEDKENAARAWLEDNTTVLDVDGGGVIIANF